MKQRNKLLCLVAAAALCLGLAACGTRASTEPAVAPYDMTEDQEELLSLLGLTDKEKAQILSINLSNAPERLYKEVWIGLGGVHSAVYATETSLEEYLCYTTEETEKLELQRLTEKLGGNIELAIRQLAEQKRNEDH